MSRLAYFLRLSVNHLRRGGELILVATLCIVFGVMSLVAMSMLAGSIERTLVLEPRQVLGGDLSLGRIQEEVLLPEHIEQLQALQDSGQIERFTVLAYTSTLMYHRPGSGEVRFTGSGMGIDPSTYPLAGALVLSDPGNVGLPTLLQQPGDLVITRDIAREEGLQVGDPLSIADPRGGMQVSGTIRGIAGDTPNHQGSKIYYSMQTAALLAGGRPAANTAIANTGQAGTLIAILVQTGWMATAAPQMAAGHTQSEDLILMCVRGAGMLGLLVGGIGIANTMHVLLKRRQREVAIWKVLGYRDSQMAAIFAQEALLMGAAGSVLGAGLGVLVSSELTEMFRRTSNLLFEWRFSPGLALTGVAAGVLTTLIFAMWAIASVSQVRPMALLRNEAVEAGRLPRIKSAGLLICLAVPFAALTSLVMGSIPKGIGVLAFALAGLALLGGFFAGAILAATRLLALRPLPLVRLAQKSLRRRAFSLVFAMIALFAGVLTITAGVVVTQGSQREMQLREIDVEGYNLNVIAPAGQEAAIRQAVVEHAPEQTGLGYMAPVKAIRLGGTSEATGMQNLLIGRSDPFDYQLTGAPWGSQPEGVYAANQSDPLPVGSQVEVELWDGTLRTYPVVGSYDRDWSPGHLYPPSGLLLPADLFAQTVQPETVTLFVRIPASRLSRVTSALGQSLPQATVIDLVAYATRFIQTYKNLFVLAVSMAALALLAGVLLVANSVSLAMLERRYEIGILKTLGFTRGHILAALGVEYSLIALIASAAGLMVVRGFLLVLGLGNPLAASVLRLPVPLAAGILVGATALILVTVFLVTGRPTRVSPVFVLNERVS